MAEETASCQNVDGVVLDDELDRLAADVFSACRDGDISRLRSLVDGRLKDQVGSLVASKTNGASSLIMACRNGHAAVVSFLVTRCHADIEQVGSVTFDGEVLSPSRRALFLSLCQRVVLNSENYQTLTPALTLDLTFNRYSGFQ